MGNDIFPRGNHIVGAMFSACIKLVAPVLAVGMVAFATCPAQARLIEVVLDVPAAYESGKPWAYAENSISDGRAPVKAINGSGLTKLNEGVWSHTYDNGHREQAWHGKKTSGTKPFATWFLVDMGESKTFDAFRIWNGLEYTQRGLKNVDVYLSNTYEPTDRTKMKPTDATEHPDFTSNCWTHALNTNLNKGATTKVDGVDRHLGQIVPMGGTKTARWFAFKINSVQGESSDSNTGYGNICELKFFYSSVPDVETKSVAEVSRTDAKVKGNLILKPGVESGDVNVVWGTENGGQDASDWQHTSKIERLPAGEFTASLTNLNAATSYFVAFWAYDATLNETNWSETAAFTTAGSIPIALTPPDDFWEVDPMSKAFVVSIEEPFATDTVVHYTVGGSAADAYSGSFSGVVTIPAGQTSATIDFSPKDNTASAEGGETLTISLLGSETSATVTIIDDETHPERIFYFDNAAEGTAFETAGNWLQNGSGSVRAVPQFVDSARFDSNTTTSGQPAVSTGVNGVKNLTLNSGHLAVTAGTLAVNAVTRVGYASNTVASLTVDGGYFRHGTGDFSIGYDGSGTVTLDSGAIYCVGGSKIGHRDGSLGVFNLNGGVLHYNYPTAQFVGYEAGSRGVLNVNGGRLEIDQVGANNYSWLRVGYSSGATGEVTVTSGSTLTNLGYRVAIGDKGTGSWRQSGGQVEMRRLVLGNEPTGVGTMVATGGKIKITAEALTVGNDGTGFLYVTNLVTESNSELITDHQIVIGANAGSFGYIGCDNVYFHESSGGKGNGFIIGRSGHGEMVGRRIALKSYDRSLIIADKDGSFGLLRGWGNINLTESVINNGLVIADGLGDADGTNGFDFSRDKNYGGGVSNLRDNPANGTNGWYAVNRAKIKWQRVKVEVPGEGQTTRTVNIGEPQGDSEIDLVNSVRFTVTNPTSQDDLWAVLYAPDHPDVPKPSRVASAAGVWKIHYEPETFDSVGLTFRYDHVKAPRGVKILHYN